MIPFVPKLWLYYPQEKHLMLYLKILNLNEPLHRWINSELFPRAISKSLWLVELHLKVEIYFARRQNVNKVVSDKEPRCFKNE